VKEEIKKDKENFRKISNGYPGNRKFLESVKNRVGSHSSALE
jgi:hypothetical protein